MANASAQHYALSPRLSIEEGAPFFAPGEHVLLRIPDIHLDGSLDTDTAVVSGLPPTSRASTSQHFASVRTAVLSE